jgi:hypothetical protein
MLQCPKPPVTDPRRDPKLLAILDPLPRDWPKTGTFRGQAIDLNVARATLNGFELADVLVDLPGIGPSYPWRGSEYVIDADGKIRL